MKFSDCHKDFFNQPRNSNECGFRCMWLLLSLKDRVNCPMQEFINTFTWLSPAYGGLFVVDMYRMLSYLKMKYRLSIPDRKGTYLILYPSTDNIGHAVLYMDGILYDSTEPCPRSLRLGTLKERISSKEKPSINVCVSAIEIL
jgi:hypothetical protein